MSAVSVSLRPLGDRVVVKALVREAVTKSGIVLPDTAKEKPQEAVVVAVGPGKQDDGKVVPLDVKKGDRVLFGKYGGSEVTLDGEEYVIVSEDEVLAVLE